LEYKTNFFGRIGVLILEYNLYHAEVAMDIITRLEEVVLIAIWRLKGDAYGVTINEAVSDASGKDYSLGALYFTLDQLHKKGYVHKTAGAPTPERGGRSKTYYRLTPEGIEALRQARSHQEALWEGLNGLVTGEEDSP
jgi:DNA-binding PadR family transcriptional regulator